MKIFTNTAPTFCALILCGGSSSRFFPLQEKPLFQLAGQSLLQKSITAAKNGGAARALVVASADNAQQIQVEAEAIANNLGFEVEVTTQPRGGLAEAVLCARDKVQKDEGLLVMCTNDLLAATKQVDQADDDCSGSLRGFFGNALGNTLGNTLGKYTKKLWKTSVLQNLVYKAHSGNVDAVILGHIVENYFPGGYLLCRDEKVVDIIEKPKPGTQPSDMVTVLLHYFPNSKPLMSALESQGGAEEGRYERSLMQLERVAVLRHRGRWQAIKYPWDLLKALPLVLSGISSYRAPSATIHKSAIIEGPVHIADGADIGAFAVIRGPAYIGQNATVGTHSLVRESLVENGALVGAHTEVARSIICPGAKLHRNYVGDSVVGQNALLGGGSVLANVRFDGAPVRANINGEKKSTDLIKCGAIIGQNAKLGVNTTCMPGTLFPPNSVLLPSDS